MIFCTHNCVYQQEGLCRLTRAVSAGNTKSDCAYYLPKTADKTMEMKKMKTVEE